MAESLRQTDAPAAGRRLVFWGTIVSLALLTYGMTPLTNNLDDIKVTFMFCLFPWVMTAYLVFVARGDCPAPPPAVSVLLGLYMAAMAASSMASPHSWAGWQTTAFTFAALGCFFGPIGCVRTREDLERLMLALVLVCLGAEVFGVFHRLNGVGILREAMFPRGGESALGWRAQFHGLLYTLDNADYQMFSTILNRDFFAAYLNMMIPLALGLAVATDRPWARAASLACVALGSLCILLAMSKNDYVIFVCAPILFFALYWVFVRQKPIRIPHWPIWVAGVLVIYGTIFFLRWSQFSAQLKLFSPDALGRTVVSRMIIWKAAIGIWMDHPLLGGGPGSFRLLSPLHRRADYHLNDISTITEYAHNLFLDYLSETGLIGAGAALALLLCILWLAFRQILRDDDKRLRTLQCGLFSGLAAILVASATSPLTRWPIGVANFYTVLGVAVAAANISRLRGLPAAPAMRLSSGKSRLAVSLAAAAIAGIGAVLCFVQGLRYFSSAVENQKGLSYVSYAESVVGQAPDIGIRTYTRAVESFERAIAINPYFLTSYYKLGHTYHSLYRFDQANSEDWLLKSLETYERLRKLAPDYSEIHYNFGIIHESLGGLAYLRSQAAESDELKQKHIQQAVVELEIAAAEYDFAALQSTKLATQRAAARGHEKLAELLDGDAQRAELERSLAIFERLVQYDPGRPDVAAPISQGGDPRLRDTRRAHGMLLQQLGYDDRAAEVLYEYLLEFPGDRDASYALARALNGVMSRDPERVLEILDSLIASNPLRLDYRIYRYTMHYNMKQYDKALPEALKAHRINPGDWQTLLFLGEIYLGLNQVEPARACFERLVNNPSARSSAHGQKAAEWLGRLDEALGAADPTPGE